MINLKIVWNEEIEEDELNLSSYLISECPTINISSNWTSPSRTEIINNINNYLWCKVLWYTWVVAWYTYSWTISNENKMILIMETTFAGATWWLKTIDISWLNNITSLSSSSWSIEWWDWFQNTKNILNTQWIWTTYAAQKCYNKWNLRYLPASEELNQIFCHSTNAPWYRSSMTDCINKWFTSDYFWIFTLNINYEYYSSTEASEAAAYFQDMETWWRWYPYSKDSWFYYRCVTRF